MALQSQSLLGDIHDVLEDRQDAPAVAITRDGQDRITEVVHTYSDYTVTYTVTWAAATGAEIDTITKVVA